MNSVCLSGRAVEDVWIRKNNNGRLIASFIIHEGTSNIRCVAFDKMADKAGMFVRKNKFVELSGELSLYRNKTREGEFQYIYNVQVDYLDVFNMEDDEVDE